MVSHTIVQKNREGNYGTCGRTIEDFLAQENKERIDTSGP
jgi:hypothetical protein